MRRVIKLGDRFEWKLHLKPKTAKVIEFREGGYYVIDGPKAGNNCDDLISIFNIHNGNYWEYLGNYGKTNHFETLYNLLNDNQDR